MILADTIITENHTHGGIVNIRIYVILLVNI